MSEDVVEATMSKEDMVNVGVVVDKDHTFKITIRKKDVVDVLEFEDVLFNLNSAVMLPDEIIKNQTVDDENSLPDEEASVKEKQEFKGGLSAIAEIFRYRELNEKNKAKKIAIFGHTDTSGEPGYNQKLSFFRAQGVLLLILGGNECAGQWCELYKANKSNGVNVWNDEDLDIIFSWACSVHGFDIDIKKESGNSLSWRIQRFKMNWNNIFDPPSSDRIDPGNATTGKKFWKAVYILYQYALAQIMKPQKMLMPTRKEFADGSSDYNTEWTSVCRNSLKWINGTPGASMFGCGEFCPIEEEEMPDYYSKVNRRVEVMFFDGLEKSIIKLTCNNNECVIAKDKNNKCSIHQLKKNMIKGKLLYTWEASQTGELLFRTDVHKDNPDEYLFTLEADSGYCQKMSTLNDDCNSSGNWVHLSFKKVPRDAFLKMTVEFNQESIELFSNVLFSQIETK
jgi:hypothetical protein